jgi:hypothetical protein
LSSPRLTAIREYTEQLPVAISVRESRQLGNRWDAGVGRLVIEASNQGGFDGVEVDLLDVIKWVRENRPDLLACQEHDDCRRNPELGHACDGREAAARLSVALRALEQLVNGSGHTAICWRDREKGVGGCSDACALARAALGYQPAAVR